MTVDIITPWLNQPQLIPAYEAAVAGARVIVLDQASDPDTAAALDAMVARLGNGSRVIHNATNRYYAAANNQGLERARDGVVVFLNNDVFGAECGEPNRWLSYVTDPQVGIPPGMIAGPSVLPFHVDAEVVLYVEGWCMAGHAATFRAIGGWNERDFPRAYAEDVELCWRAARAGVKLAATRWPIRHIGNVTNSQTPDGYAHADEQRERLRQMVRAAREAA